MNKNRLFNFMAIVFLSDCETYRVSKKFNNKWQAFFRDTPTSCHCCPCEADSDNIGIEYLNRKRAIAACERHFIAFGKNPTEEQIILIDK